MPPIAAETVLQPRELVRSALGAEDTELLIGVVGRLSPLKYPGLVIDAVSRLPESDRASATVLFVGAGPLAADLRGRASEVGIDARFSGSIPNAASLMAAFDLIVVPSQRETFCLSMAEAIMAKVPEPFAVASPGSRWLTDDGRLLGLAEPNGEALAQAILAARGVDPAQLAASRAYLKSQFNADHVRDAYRAWVGAAE